MVSLGTDCSGMDTPVMALQQLGISIDHQFACDVNKYAKATIMANYAPKRWYDDLTLRDNANVAHVDLYVAGFPCQPFSVAGLGQGFGDAKGRGTIFWKVREYIDAQKPKVFVLENVKGIVTRSKGSYLQAILQSLDELGCYNVFYRVLDTKDHGVPQTRQRLYLVGILKSCDKGTFEWPESVPRPSIEKFLEPRKRLPTIDTLPPRSRVGGEGNSRIVVKQELGKLLKSGRDPFREPWIIDCGSSPYRTSARFDYTPCITCARSNGHWITNRGRRLKKEEQMRLQGMPTKDFKVVVSERQLGLQIGNAMSVNVLERIFVRLLPAAGLYPASRLHDRWGSQAEDQAVPAPATPPQKRKATSPPLSPSKLQRVAPKICRELRATKA